MSSSSTPENESLDNNNDNIEIIGLKNASEYSSAEEELKAIDSLLNEEKVKLNENMDNFVVVDNLPVIDESKKGKLFGLLRSKFSSCGKLALNSKLTEKGVFMPFSSEGKSLGYAFIEYKDNASSKKAIEKLNGKDGLGKRYVFRINYWKDFQTYEKIREEYTEPNKQEFKDTGNLKWWLLDERAIDQYVLRYGDHTDIVWNESGKKPETIRSQRHWAETFVRWSPFGSYLATFHKQGVMIWGGEDWKKIQKFQHVGVQLIQFSPSEGYVITTSPRFHDKDSPENPKTFLIWNVLTGKLCRGFSGRGLPKDKKIFHWSHDDKYVAMLNEQGIGIYETPDLRMLTDPNTGKRKSLDIPNIQQFAWSPKKNIIAAFIEKKGTVPARVILIDIPSRRIIDSRTAFMVSQCNLSWSSNGQYLCVKLIKVTKNDKFAATQLDIYNLHRKRKGTIAVDTIEIRHHIFRFAWEPNANKFAVIHSHNPATTRPDVSFYKVTGKEILKIKTLDKRACNHILWSPRGRFIVLAGLGNLNGHFEFFDADKLETMGDADHFSASEIAWDPTGRFLTSTVSIWLHKMENGYNIYTFSGKLVQKVLKDRFYQLLWRPRPKFFLPDAKVKSIKKNLNNYKARYEAEDRARKKQILLEVENKRNRQTEEFNAWAKKANDAWMSLDKERTKLWGYDYDQRERDDWQETTEQVEEIIEIIEEEVQSD